MSNELLTNKICEHIGNRFETGELDNADLVQIIEHLGGYLNLATISQYAGERRMSYNGVKKFRETKELFGVKFVIDNK